MIHLLFSALVVVVCMYLVGKLMLELLFAITQPLRDRDERRHLARQAEWYAEQRAAQEREYQEYVRAEDERARIKCALARIALECHQEK
jgi:hypothetical protein